MASPSHDVRGNRSPVFWPSQWQARVRHLASALPPELRLFAASTIGLGLVCALSEVFCAVVLHLDGVYTWPTLPFYDCTDFRCFLPRFEHFHQLDFFSDDPGRGIPFGYPAAGAVMYECFYLVKWQPLIFFFVATLAGLGALLWLLGRRMRAQHTPLPAIWMFLIATVIFSYPLWFEYLLANMEICILLLVSGGVLAFLRERGYAAATCFALAGSVKIYPLIYLGLLLSRRKYRELVFGLLLPLPVTVASLWLVCPSLTVAQRGISNGLTRFSDAYLLTYRTVESGFDHSLFGLLKHWYPFDSVAQLQSGMHLYLGLGAVAGTMLYFMKIRRLPIVNQLICLCVASLLLPPLSHDYTLLQLYVPWGMLVILALRAARLGRTIPGLAAAFTAFAILFAPETELIYAGQTLGGPLKSFVLVFLFAVALRYPFVVLEPAYATKHHDPDMELVAAS